MSLGWLSTFLSADWWAGIEAIATAAAAVGIGLASKQLRFDAWLKAQEIFVEKEFTAARTRVFRHLEGPPAKWDIEDQEAGLLVCRRLDEICRLAPYFALTKAGGESVILEAWDEAIGNSWGLLQPLLEAEREKVRSGKKWQGFKELGTKALGRLPSAQQDLLQSVTSRLSPQIRTLRLPQSQPAIPAGAA